MDEDKKTDIMETYTAPGGTPPLPSAPLSWRDGAAPALAIALAWLFWDSFDPVRMGDFGFPHLGVLALVCAHFAAVLTILGKRARLTAGSLFCTGAALALAVSCALYDSGVLLVLNCFVILFTAAMATFALSGHLAPGRARAIHDTVMFAVLALFTRVCRPFQALGQLRRQKGGAALGTAALAALIALPVLGLVLWLLSSADAVFGSLFARFDLTELPAGSFARLLRVLILGLFLCSALWFIREAPPERCAPHGEKQRRAALFLPVTVLLDLVYIIFCAIQIKYLFGGAEEVSMAGGWAEYARSGFFQLVAVAAIDLGLVLLGTDAGRFASRGGKLLRAAFGLLLALTAVILFSAFWRMRLYIGAFGMSLLRLMTLWAMAVIAVGILTAGWKLARPGAGFFRAAGGFALASWCLLCLAGPCGMVARYNVNGYVSGQLRELDTVYLRQLGPDALPALSPLQEAGPESREAYEELLRQLTRPAGDRIPWPQRSLSGSRVRR